MIRPTAEILKRVTSISYKKGQILPIQVTALYEEAIDRAGRVIVKRSTTFHMKMEADGLFHWRCRVPQGRGAWAEIHRTFTAKQIPGLKQAAIVPIEIEKAA